MTFSIFQNKLNLRIARDSFWEYLQYAAPVDLTRKDAEKCNTHPQYFLWPSEEHFLRYRGVVSSEAK